MTETELSVEQRIAQFLVSHDILIVPVRIGQYEQLNFLQQPHDSSMRHFGGGFNFGSLTYDTTTGTTEPINQYTRLASHHLKGFARTVIKPLAKLLEQVKGDLHDDRFQPIHDALDKVEAKYRQIPSPPK
ncbi:MAG: hypothetical protein Q8L34_02450 [Candidatus Woesearchaeota archaeon]|nr:hypothetical protein [Candidatus Woesearchaeota archaeon]